ncbi:MAG: LysR family transcriptional regulator [Rhodobacteraceae bacterium]|nr:LysR family transcriptional regulator [Paracoccaceae bacterium]
MHGADLVWDDARVFLAVARAGTLTGATGALGGGIATTSRRIERLEDALGLPLFIRHQSGYRLTDEGAALVPRAEALEAAAKAFGASAEEAQGEVSGRVRLATAENLATPLLIPSLPSLLAAHPRLELEIVTNVQAVNLHRREADLALRLVRPERGHVAQRRLGTLGYGLYAAPGWSAGRAAGPEPYIGWAEVQADLPAARWIEQRLAGRPPVLATTTLASQVSAARAGLGIAVLPHFLARAAGLEALPEDPGLSQEIWLVLHADLAAARRVRVVADHIAALIHHHHQELAGV